MSGAGAPGPRGFGHRVRVRLVRERKAGFGPAVASAADVAALFRDELLELDREHFLCCHLDVKHRILSTETVSIGHLTAALVHPREVFKGALLANAASVLLVHNHPSGDPEPSREDLDLTGRLVRAGDLLGVPVLDHVIVAAAGHLSLAERGMRR